MKIYYTLFLCNQTTSNLVKKSYESPSNRTAIITKKNKEIIGRNETKGAWQLATTGTRECCAAQVEIGWTHGSLRNTQTLGKIREVTCRIWTGSANFIIYSRSFRFADRPLFPSSRRASVVGFRFERNEREDSSHGWFFSSSLATLLGHRLETNSKRIGWNRRAAIKIKCPSPRGSPLARVKIIVNFRFHSASFPIGEQFPSTLGHNLRELTLLAGVSKFRSFVSKKAFGRACAFPDSAVESMFQCYSIEGTSTITRFLVLLKIFKTCVAASYVTILSLNIAQTLPVYRPLAPSWV